MLEFALGNRKPVIYRTNAPWYDHKESIAQAIKTLEDLHRLIRERHIAGYERRERLSDFYIFGGRFRFDSCGNTMRATVDPLPERFRVLLPVATQQEFLDYLAECQISDSRIDTCVSHSISARQVPTEGLKCAHCSKPWTIENVYDVEVQHGKEVFPLTEFVGKTLGHVRHAFENRTDAVYRMHPEILLRNDRHIDHTPVNITATEKWKRGQVVNKFGWIGVNEGVGDETRIAVEDEGHFEVSKFFHAECLTQHMEKKTEQEFRQMLSSAGFTRFTMESVPNEYGSVKFRGPWFLVTAGDVVFRIGWRSHVIEISWTQCLPSLKKKLAVLFVNEKTTHTENLVHADSDAHAVDCLTRMFTSCTEHRLFK